MYCADATSDLTMLLAAPTRIKTHTLIPRSPITVNHARKMYIWVPEYFSFVCLLLGSPLAFSLLGLGGGWVRGCSYARHNPHPGEF